VASRDGGGIKVALVCLTRGGRGGLRRSVSVRLRCALSCEFLSMTFTRGCSLLLLLDDDISSLRGLILSCLYFRGCRRRRRLGCLKEFHRGLLRRLSFLEL